MLHTPQKTLQRKPAFMPLAAGAQPSLNDPPAKRPKETRRRAQDFTPPPPIVKVAPTRR